MRESTHWSDTLLGKIEFSHSVVIFSSLSNSIDSLVLFGSMMITVITNSSHCPLDISWMPSTNTTYSSKTSMSLSRQLLNTKSLYNTGYTMSFSYTKNITELEVFKDLVNAYFLFEKVITEVHFRSNISSIDLDFKNISFLLDFVQLRRLCVTDKSDNSTILFKSVKNSLSHFSISLKGFSVFGETFLFTLIPVLVKSSLELVSEVFSPKSGKSSKSFYGLNVSNKSNNSDWRSLDNGYCFNYFLLVYSGFSSVNLS